jgi:hypothetical protein
MKILLTATTALLVLCSYSLQAHHSFAIYDIDNKISRTGVLTKFEFSNPHIKMVLEVVGEDGNKETWNIESMNPRRWDDRDLPRDVAEVGETVTIVGWPARNGKDNMSISAITTERGTTVILDEVNQPGVRDIVPPPTVKRV